MKKKIIILIITLLVIVGVVGSSYAYLKAEKVGNQTGLTLTEVKVILLNDMTSVNLDKTYPMEDVDGLKNPKTTFKIKNEGKILANYKVSLVDKETLKSTMKNEDVRYQLKRTSEKTGVTTTFEIKNLAGSGLMDEGTIEVGEVISYELIAWVDYEANPNNLTFNKVVLVEGMQVASLDKSGANYPELLENMLPVYYEKTGDTTGVWKIADSKNLNSSYKWFDYNNFMWANAVTVKEKEYIAGETENSYAKIDNSKYTILENGDIAFDGVDDYLDLGNKNHDFKNQVTMIARFKVNELDNANHQIFSNVEVAGLCITIEKQKILFVSYINNAYRYVINPEVTTTDTWYTVVGTYDGSNEKLYINGVLVATTAITGNIKISNAVLALGMNPVPGLSVGTEYNNCVISDAMIYERALSAEEVSTYFKGEIGEYPTNKLFIAYNGFNKIEKTRIPYLKESAGTTIPMEDITSMWVWIPRYKYTIFNGNNENTNEQMIDIKFEHGIDKTGTVTCVDNIQTDNNSSSSETCTDTKNGSIKNGISTYTHPAFTFGGEELTGFWMAKFEMSTDDTTCINSQSNTNCNTPDLNILIKPDVISLRYQTVSNMFATIRRMERYNNIHGFKQNSLATTYLDKNGNLTGEINHDDNNFDIHAIKNMEWGAVAYLSQSRYGKYGNVLYTGDNRRIFKNNNSSFKTGYSGGSYNSNSSTTATYLYNDLTDLGSGKGYRGAGASTTGTVYGVYDMNGGAWERTMGNVLDKNGNLTVAKSTFAFSLNKIPIAKYYDKYSYNTEETGLNSFSRGKLGDATKETITNFNSWGSLNNLMPTSNYPWFLRGGYTTSNNYYMIFHVTNGSGTSTVNNGGRPVLTITRNFPWLDK